MISDVPHVPLKFLTSKGIVVKIVDAEVIAFKAPGTWPHGRDSVQSLTKVVTDEGAEGYYLGGHGHGDLDGLRADDRASLEGYLKSLVGHDPYDRETFWNWMWTRNMPEHLLSAVDNVLWDLQGRALGLPIHKLLGGCRDRVKAYASTIPNMGTPEEYAKHALDCKAQGYTAYKIHPYYFFDPNTGQANSGRPSNVDYDIAAARLIREAVGDDMVLMFDPWGTYRNYEEAYKVGRALEDLNYYWFEHPMPEYRVAAYEKLCSELTIPILSPEIAAGSIFSRADWILRGASDMSRIDVLRGGITGAKKMASICEAFGLRCELHMSGFGNLQVLGATSEDTCEYYERGLLGLDIDYETPAPYLEEISDPMDAEGYVKIPDGPGMGYKLRWDYIDDNRL